MALVSVLLWLLLACPMCCDSRVNGWYKDTQQSQADRRLDVSTQLGAQQEIEEEWAAAYSPPTMQKWNRKLWFLTGGMDDASLIQHHCCVFCQN